MRHRNLIIAGTLLLLTAGCASPPVREIRAVFRCPGGEKIETIFRDESVRVALPDGTTAELPRAVSASGARYSDGTTTLWNKGDTVFIMRGEEIVLQECVEEAR